MDANDHATICCLFSVAVFWFCTLIYINCEVVRQALMMILSLHVVVMSCVIVIVHYCGLILAFQSGVRSSVDPTATMRYNMSHAHNIQ